MTSSHLRGGSREEGWSFFFFFFVHLLFSLSMLGLCLRERWNQKRSTFGKLVVFLLSQFSKVQLMFFFFFLFLDVCFFNLYFWSYSTAPTAHRQQRGPKRENSEFTNIVPEEEKREKLKYREVHTRKGNGNNSISSPAVLGQVITDHILIAF